MAQFATSLAIARAPVRSGALRAISVGFWVVTVASAATAGTLTTKIATGMLWGIQRHAALERVIAGLVLTLSSLLLHLIFWRGLEGLVVFRVQGECSLRLDPCLEAGIKGEVVIAFLDCSADLWM